ncbi:Cadherin EGF LAG seven-pass G-type receptor 2 [Stylophora pistillata]|uniref:Cadherin EGF LAG seven-pass G-type receptor 2 n=1 Tax=Stylophora pistillata TaxID=50429 RepID=A0A2B4R8C0_STYPI|nr:Cadherin EGF LAG seven-pass G-type receptor 2 [Stylophora pistillata]
MSDERTTWEINSIIMAATITPLPTRLQENITMKFKNIQNVNNKEKCMFWNIFHNSSVGWSGQGCYVKSIDAHQTECTCNHLTHFAVLLEASSSLESADITEKDKKALKILTYIGLTLSIIGISLTIISYVTLTDIRGPLSQIRVSLVASLGAGQVIFLAGIGATENKARILNNCWMSSANGLIWIFVVFVVAIQCLNILILGRVIKEMTTMEQHGDKDSKQLRLGVKACVVMIPLLGISWLFGLLSPLQKAIAYIFTIINSSQIRARLRRKIQAIFPTMDDGTSTKRTSVMPLEVNEDVTTDCCRQNNKCSATDHEGR